MACPSGGGGIRTHGAAFAALRFSRPVHSSALAPRRSSQFRRGAELHEHGRNAHRAVFLLEVLEHRERPAVGHRRPVERVHVLGAAVRAVTDPEAPRLVIGGVRGGGQLTVALLGREPCFEVVPLCGRRAQLRGGDVDHAVRQAEFGGERLLDRQQPLMLRPRLVGPDIAEHLDLVELMDAEHPARVAARGARLAPEVRRERRVAERQLLGVEDLARVQPGQRDLRGPGEEEPFVDDLVDLEALGGEEPGAEHRFLADEHRRDHRLEALGDDAVQRPAVEREGETCRVADDVAEPGAREPGRAFHLEAAELEMILRGPFARLADHAHDLTFRVVALLVRNRLVRRARNLLEQLVAGRLRRREVGLDLLQPLLDPFQLLELLGSRLPLDLLPPAQLVDLGHELAPALVGGEQLVEGLRGGGALARDGRSEGLRIGPRGSEVDQPLAVRKATRSAICLSFSVWPKFGITFGYPGCTYAAGFLIDVNAKVAVGPLLACFAYWSSLSRSGPTVPCEPAGVKTWQPPQPFEAKRVLPAAGSPVGTEAWLVVGTVPITVSAVGSTVPEPPQPARMNAIARNGARRRMNARV